ncbi:hypothetical protein GCM10027160_09130 [Streptomyces calidiresistens]
MSGKTIRPPGRPGRGIRRRQGAHRAIAAPRGALRTGTDRHRPGNHPALHHEDPALTPFPPIPAIPGAPVERIARVASIATSPLHREARTEIPLVAPDST